MWAENVLADHPDARQLWRRRSRSSYCTVQIWRLHEPPLRARQFLIFRQGRRSSRWQCMAAPALPRWQCYRNRISVSVAASAAAAPIRVPSQRTRAQCQRQDNVHCERRLWQSVLSQVIRGCGLLQGAQGMFWLLHFCREVGNTR